MARLDIQFSEDDLPEDTGGNFDPIPSGDYEFTIEGADLKDTKAGTGQLINLKLRVDGPTHMGRFIFGKLNIKNESSKAELIGRAQLGTILRALGIPAADFEDTDQLLGGRVGGRVKIKPAEGQYPAGNEIAGYKVLGDGGSAAPAPAPRAAAPAPRPAAPAKAAPPWATKK